MIAALLSINPSSRLQTLSSHSTSKEQGPLRVALAGLVHGHASGFFGQFQKRQDLQIVGIAEADHQLAARFASRYALQRGIFYGDLEEMLKATHPQQSLLTLIPTIIAVSWKFARVTVSRS